MSGVPVYVTTCAADEIRAGYAQAVIARWLRDREADPVVVLDVGAHPALWRALADWGHRPGSGKLVRVEMPREGSQKARHVYALRDGRQRGAAWIVSTDDDCEPRPEANLRHAVDLADAGRVESTPRFGVYHGCPYGMVALALPGDCSLPHVFRGRTPSLLGYPPVEEAGAVGGCRLLRTALDPDRLPPYAGVLGYDGDFSDGVRAQGYAVGFFGDSSPRSLRVQHHGHGQSTVWPYLFMPDTLPRASGTEH